MPFNEPQSSPLTTKFYNEGYELRKTNSSKEHLEQWELFENNFFVNFLLVVALLKIDQIVLDR